MLALCGHPIGGARAGRVRVARARAVTTRSEKYSSGGIQSTPLAPQARSTSRLVAGCRRVLPPHRASTQWQSSTANEAAALHSPTRSLIDHDHVDTASCTSRDPRWRLVQYAPVPSSQRTDGHSRGLYACLDTPLLTRSCSRAPRRSDSRGSWGPGRQCVVAGPCAGGCCPQSGVTSAGSAICGLVHLEAQCTCPAWWIPLTARTSLDFVAMSPVIAARHIGDGDRASRVAPAAIALAQYTAMKMDVRCARGPGPCRCRRVDEVRIAHWPMFVGV